MHKKNNTIKRKQKYSLKNAKKRIVSKEIKVVPGLICLIEEVLVKLDNQELIK